MYGFLLPQWIWLVAWLTPKNMDKIDLTKQQPGFKFMTVPQFKAKNLSLGSESTKWFSFYLWLLSRYLYRKTDNFYRWNTNTDNNDTQQSKHHLQDSWK